MNKLHLSIFVIISFILSGCVAAATPTLFTTPILPTLSPSEQATPTAVIFAPTLETSTQVAPVATATSLSTDTPPPTATSAMIIVIVSDVPQVTVPPPQGCQPPPRNWVVYTVQRNDTLSSLGQRTGVGLQQIQTANCLSSTTIFAGQTLYLPFIPQPPGTGNTGPTSTIEVLPVPSATLAPQPTIEIPPAPGPGDPTVTVLPTSGSPTTRFKLLITDFKPNEPVTIRIFYVPTQAIVFQKSSVVNDAGDLLDYFPSTADTAVGSYTVDASGTSSAATGAFTVTGN